MTKQRHQHSTDSCLKKDSKMQNMGVKKQQWSVEVSIHNMGLEPAPAVEKQAGSWLFCQFQPTWHWHRHLSSTSARVAVGHSAAVVPVG